MLTCGNTRLQLELILGNISKQSDSSSKALVPVAARKIVSISSIFELDSVSDIVTLAN